MTPLPSAIGRAVRIHLDESCRDRRTPARLLDVLRSCLRQVPVSTKTIARQIQRPVPHTIQLLTILAERGEAVHDERGWRAA